MTAYSTGEARDAIAGLVGTGAADVCKERDELLERLHAVRQTVFPHLRERTPRGELACDIEAEADPHPEPDACEEPTP